MVKRTTIPSICRIHSVILLVVYLALPIFPLPVEGEPGELPTATECRPVIDPDGVV